MQHFTCCKLVLHPIKMLQQPWVNLVCSIALGDGDHSCFLASYLDLLSPRFKEHLLCLHALHEQSLVSAAMTQAESTVRLQPMPDPLLLTCAVPLTSSAPRLRPTLPRHRLQPHRMPAALQEQRLAARLGCQALPQWPAPIYRHSRGPQSSAAVRSRHRPRHRTASTQSTTGATSTAQHSTA